MRGMFERDAKARLSFSGGLEEVNFGGEKNSQDMSPLLRCTALYFVRQVFANP